MRAVPQALCRLAAVTLLALAVGAAPAAADGDTRVYLPIVRGAQPRPVIASFSASPARSEPGGSSTLAWQVSNATSLSISPGVGAVSGNSVTVAPGRTTEYTLTASNSAGVMIAKAAVIVPSAGEGAVGQLFAPSVSNATRPAVVTDATGGVHLAYSHASAGAGVYPAQYAYCADDCGLGASWAAVVVGNEGYWGGDVKLALDPQGRPRMVWLQQFLLGEYGRIMYAACDQNCTQAGSWIVTPLMEAFLVSSGDYFTLDPLGRPRFAYAGRGGANYVAFCDANCGSQSSWAQLRIDSDQLDPYVLGLSYDPQGQLRMAFTTNPSRGPIAFGYAECDVDCLNITSWRFLTNIFDMAVGYNLALRLDAQGRPRVAVYTGYNSDTPATNDLLYYLWCQSDCTASKASWASARVPLPPDYGGAVALALDHQNLPRLAYNVDDNSANIDGLGYSWCAERCETTGGAWQHRLIERASDLGGRWLYLGLNATLHVDAAGNPRMAYEARQCCGDEGVKLVRFAQFNQP